MFGFRSAMSVGDEREAPLRVAQILDCVCEEEKLRGLRSRAPTASTSEQAELHAAINPGKRPAVLEVE